jgi:glycosyltransferase involved in cell wall biosynthesis
MDERAPHVSVYVASRDYGRWLRDAVDSVLAQTFHDWELLLIDDGSVDDTPEIMAGYASVPGVRVTRFDRPLGLRRVINHALEKARGTWLLRLDADDVLHPRALELLVAEEAVAPSPVLVFPDYLYLDEQGDVIGIECAPRELGEYQAESFPPHGAGCLVRRSFLQEVGMSELYERQDGHELWLKAVAVGASVRHVDLPLFGYRQHERSLSADQSRVLADRASIKRDLAEDARRRAGTTFVAVVPFRHRDPGGTNGGDDARLDALGRAVVDAFEAGCERVVVSTDVAHIRDIVAFPAGVEVLERGDEAGRPQASIREILVEVRDALDLDDDSVICLLGLETPARSVVHIQEALHTYELYDVDSVVAVYEERNMSFRRGARGLEPLNPARQYELRREREVVYIDPGLVRLIRVANLEQPRYLGERIGHILVPHRVGRQLQDL